MIRRVELEKSFFLTAGPDETAWMIMYLYCSHNEELGFHMMQLLDHTAADNMNLVSRKGAIYT